MPRVVKAQTNWLICYNVTVGIQNAFVSITLVLSNLCYSNWRPHLRIMAHTISVMGWYSNLRLSGEGRVFSG